MVFRLGIDAGGTYTDAVLVATFKNLTTRYDLTISNALCGLPPEMPRGNFTSWP